MPRINLQYSPEDFIVVELDKQKNLARITSHELPEPPQEQPKNENQQTTEESIENKICWLCVE